MLLRFVLFLGVMLVLLAGGAAGWQYWQGLPPETAAGPAPPAAAAPAGQDWLIAPDGGLVPREAAQVFLQQDRLVEPRRATLTLRAPLAALLAPGEALPAPVYQAAFAAIRAQALAAPLCAPLTDSLAARCALIRADLVPDSLDPASGTATFRLALAFSLKPDPAPLPNLGQSVLHSDAIGLDSGKGDLTAQTAEAALAEVLAAARVDCATRGPTCRTSAIMLDWEGPGQATARVGQDWLGPLPKGMYPAPPLF